MWWLSRGEDAARRTHCRRSWQAVPDKMVGDFKGSGNHIYISNGLTAAQLEQSYLFYELPAGPVLHVAEMAPTPCARIRKATSTLLALPKS